ncbi:hypothetical protein ABTY96_13575 [Streptomyces sp. NPDC096057]|uniref:hypothetical protein n=1 Tax=Streptomyces sp. NPDC096057 TaxID=3155543 RepID=UPI00332D7BDC
MQEAEDPAGDRKVIVSIDAERVEVQLSGKDATWVYGQAARLELLLVGAGGRKSKQPSKLKEYIAPTLLMLTLFPFMVTGGYFADPENYLNHAFNNTPMDILGSLVGAVLWLAAWVSGVKILGRANRALLLPMSEAPQGSWWHRATNSDRIALCGLLVAVITLILALVALGDPFGKETSGIKEVALVKYSKAM